MATATVARVDDSAPLSCRTRARARVRYLAEVPCNVTCVCAALDGQLWVGGNCNLVGEEAPRGSLTDLAARFKRAAREAGALRAVDGFMRQLSGVQELQVARRRETRVSGVSLLGSRPGARGG